MQTIGSRQASNTFGNLLDTVQQGEPVKVTRNRKDVAIVISIEDYELLGGEHLRLRKRAELMEQKKLDLLSELQKGIDELDNGQHKEATPEFWEKLKKSITS